MPLGILFWVIFVLALLLHFWVYRGDIQGGRWEPFGGSLVFWLLLGILGWRVFGPVVH